MKNYTLLSQSFFNWATFRAHEIFGRKNHPTSDIKVARTRQEFSRCFEHLTKEAKLTVHQLLPQTITLFSGPLLEPSVTQVIANGPLGLPTSDLDLASLQSHSSRIPKVQFEIIDPVTPFDLNNSAQRWETKSSLIIAALSYCRYAAEEATVIMRVGHEESLILRSLFGFQSAEIRDHGSPIHSEQLLLFGQAHKLLKKIEASTIDRISTLSYSLLSDSRKGPSLFPFEELDDLIVNRPSLINDLSIEQIAHLRKQLGERTSKDSVKFLDQILERALDFRHPSQFPVSIEFQQSIIQGRIFDISMSGAFIECEKCLDPNLSLEIIFTVNNQKQKSRAKIVRINPKGLRYPRGFAVQFETSPWWLKDMLIESHRNPILPQRAAA